MTEEQLEILLMLFRVILVFLFPFLLGKGLWTLEIKKKGMTFKKMYSALLYFTVSSISLLYLIKLIFR